MKIYNIYYIKNIELMMILWYNDKKYRSGGAEYETERTVYVKRYNAR